MPPTPETFLVISLAGVGDTLFATPLIHELRTNFPKAQIDALVLWAGSKDILEGNPHLNHIFQKNLLKTSKLDSIRFLSQLRKRHYDISFNTHPQSRIHYRLVAKWINARTRVSHIYENSTVLDRLLVNRRLPQDYSRHAVENNLALLNFIPAAPCLARHAYEIFLSAAELSWAERFLRENQLSGKRWIGLHVGSGGTKNLALRRWPRDNYIALIQRFLATQPGLNVLLFGGPEEETDHKIIFSTIQSKCLFAPKTQTIRQVAALLHHCFAFLSVDTALMHIAAAAHVPNQFVIETPTWNKPIEPYESPFTLIANPAVAGRNLEYYRYDGKGISGSEAELTRIMQSVSVESVFNAMIPSIRNPK